MNETEVAVSGSADGQSSRLPLIRVNRRFILTCALCATMLPLALAGSRDSENSPPVRSAVASNASPTKVVQSQPLVAQLDAGDWHMTEGDRRNGGYERWAKFETEFGMAESKCSPVIQSVRTAKYGLDRCVFEVHEIALNISGATAFEYNRGRLRHASSGGEPLGWLDRNPQVKPLENAHVGLDINIDQGRPYLGVKLVVPFGD